MNHCSPWRPSTSVFPVRVEGHIALDQPQAASLAAFVRLRWEGAICGALAGAFPLVRELPVECSPWSTTLLQQSSTSPMLGSSPIQNIPGTTRSGFEVTLSAKQGQQRGGHQGGTTHLESPLVSATPKSEVICISHHQKQSAFMPIIIITIII